MSQRHGDIAHDIMISLVMSEKTCVFGMKLAQHMCLDVHILSQHFLSQYSELCMHVHLFSMRCHWRLPKATACRNFLADAYVLAFRVEELGMSACDSALLSVGQHACNTASFVHTCVNVRQPSALSP